MGNKHITCLIFIRIQEMQISHEILVHLASSQRFKMLQ